MSVLFSPKKRKSLRMLLQDKRLQGHKTKRTRTQLNQSPFFNKEVGEPFDEESGRLQEKTLKLLVPNSKRLGGYIHMGVLFFKKVHTTQRSHEALHGFNQESTQTTLVPAEQDLKEQDEASRALP